MNKSAWIVVVAMLVAGLAVGCNKESGEKKSGAGVGVVDFGKLLQTMGYQQKMEDKVKLAAQQLDTMGRETVQPLLKEQAGLQKTLDDAVKAVAKTQPDNKEALTKDPTVMAAAQAKYIYDRRLKLYGDQYQAALENYKRTLLENWQAACVPALGKVGPQKGVDVILGKQQIGWNAADADLTAAMEEYLKVNNTNLEFANPPKWDTVIVPFEKIPMQQP